MSAFDDALSALADPPKRAAPPPARGTGSFSEFNVSPEVQAGRDDERVKILRGELAQEPDPKLRADIQMEIDRTAGGTAYGKPRATPGAASAPVPAKYDPFEESLAALSGPGPKQASTGAPRAPAREAPIAGQEEPGFVDRMIGAVKAAAPQTVGEALDPMYAHKAIGEVVTQQASGIGQAIMGGWRGLTALASGAGLDEAVRQVHAPELAGGARAEAYQPTTRQGAAAAEIAGAPGEGIAYVAKKAGEGTMEATGSPAAATTAEVAVNALPLLAGLKGAGSRVIGAQPKVVGSSSIADVAKGPAAIEAPVSNLELQTGMRERQPVPVSRQAETAPAPEAAPSPRSAPTPQAAAAAAVEQAPKFVEAMPEAAPGKSLPKADVAAREAILKEVGVPEIRRSAVEGNPAEARVDFDASKTVGPIGDSARAKINAERAALTNYAEKIVADTGGSLGMDSMTTQRRGHVILEPLEGFRDYLQKQKNDLYQDVRARVGDQPVALGDFSKTLDTNSKFASAEAQGLRRGVRSFMKELGVADKNGKPGPMTVSQAEDVRKYLNSQWRHENKGVIGEMKRAIDDDVTRTGGEDFFQKGRAMHQMEAAIFDDPKGISSILDADGINRKVSVEKIADKIASMPIDQISHIIKTLDSVPPELQPKAKAAISEIKATYANRILDIGSKTEGQWNAPGVTKFLKDNKAQMRLLFDDGEIARFQNLNQAGHILRFGPYPGAAVQSANLVRAGVAKGAELAGAGAGALVGTAVLGPFGTAAGTMIGQAAGKAAAGRYQAASELRNFEKRFTRLGDIGKASK